MTKKQDGRFADLRDATRNIIKNAEVGSGGGQIKSVGSSIANELKRRFPPASVNTMQTVVDAITAVYEGLGDVYAGLPHPYQMIINDAIITGITAWLPEDTLLGKTLKRALATLGIVMNGLIIMGRFGPESIREKITSTLSPIYNIMFAEGDGETVDEKKTEEGKSPAQPATPKRSFVDALALIDLEQRRVYSRLAELCEEEARPGVDKYEGLTGIAAVLRKAIVEAVESCETSAMNDLIGHWGVFELRRLGGLNRQKTGYRTSAEDFVKDPKVVTLMAEMINDHYGRHGSPMPAVVVDRFDALFNGTGLPAFVRAPLKKILAPGGVETLMDDVENVVYPGVVDTMRATFCAPVGSMSVILLMLFFAQLWWIGLSSEIWVTMTTLSPAMLFMRGSGLVFNLGFLFFVPLSYLAIAVYVGRPRPPRPAGEDKGDNAAVFDAWRRRYLVSILQRIAVIGWSTSVLPMIIFVCGLIALAWQFQWLTLVETVVITVIAGHLLWLVDDVGGLLLRVTGSNTASAATGILKMPTRVHRITGTLMIVILAAPLLYGIAVMLVPHFWALGVMALLVLALALGPILVSRVHAGDSAEVTPDVQKPTAKMRVMMMTRLPLVLAGVGLVIYGLGVGALGAKSLWDWHKDCEGFEATPECRVFDNGYAAYVDSTERWEVLRDRSAERLKTAKKPTGDSCNAAERAVQKMDADYRANALADPSEASTDNVCEELRDDGVLRKRFPELARTCGQYRVACSKKG